MCNAILGLGVITIIEFLVNVWSGFTTQIFDMKIMDVIDILLVAVIFYYAFKFLRERRAGKLALGVLLFMIMQFVSDVTNMRALQFILQNVLQVGLIAIIIVFQPELRSALEKVGGESIKGIKSIRDQKERQSRAGMIRELCETVTDLAADKTGALIVIEQSTKLGDAIKSGTKINADINSFLLKNIFFNKAPLHDGAVIIRDTRVYAAGCFLPLSQRSDICKDLGTRHRAAIGMSENSDAVVIVVSEETGAISVAYDGELRRGFDYMTLYSELEQLLLHDDNSFGEGEGTVKRYIRKLGERSSAEKSDKDKKS